MPEILAAWPSVGAEVHPASDNTKTGRNKKIKALLTTTVYFRKKQKSIVVDSSQN